MSYPSSREINTFQQDNARPRVARVYLEYLQQQQIETLPLPSESPDLNPIEHLWNELERCLRSQKQAPRHFKELSYALLEEWNNIHQYNVLTRRRCPAVIDAQGGQATLDIEGES